MINWYNIIIVEYQKIINLSDNTPNERSKLSWDKWWFTGTYSANSDIKFKTSMIRSNLCG